MCICDIRMLTFLIICRDMCAIPMTTYVMKNQIADFINYGYVEVSQQLPHTIYRLRICL